MSKRLTTSEFIERAKAVHGDKYDYSKVEYINSSTKVCIICPKHGEFWQKPCIHLSGGECKKCGYEKKSINNTKSTEQFIEDARKVHGDKYDYSKVEYINNRAKVCVVCPQHGEFLITPNDHLMGHGCKKCKKVHQYSTKEFIEKAKEIHGNKYDYSKVEYVNAKTKVCIICPKHGEFWQTPNAHLMGSGCFRCKYENIDRKPLLEKFIVKAKKIHNNKYDYSKVVYKNNKTRICIICPQHGEFWQTPNMHLRGNGCPHCNDSKLERKSLIYFNKLKIKNIYEKHFSWLGKQSLDFYLPEYNIAIECQGIQHFIGWHRNKTSLEYIQSLDSRKKQLCEKHGVKLYYINYNDDVEIKLKEILQENGTNKVIQ